jgi:hypothetical protein
MEQVYTLAVTAQGRQQQLKYLLCIHILVKICFDQNISPSGATANQKYLEGLM